LRAALSACARSCARRLGRGNSFRGGCVADSRTRRAEMPIPSASDSPRGADSCGLLARRFFRGGGGRWIRGLRPENPCAIGIEAVHNRVDFRGLWWTPGRDEPTRGTFVLAVGQRDELRVARHLGEAALPPVGLGLLNALLRRGHEVPPDVTRPIH